jgi:hypothetical protein
MFSDELRNLLFQVIKSWQVIAVSIALVLYMSLVSYAAREHHKPASVSKTKPRKKEKSKPAPKAKESNDEITEQE